MGFPWMTWKCVKTTWVFIGWRWKVFKSLGFSLDDVESRLKNVFSTNNHFLNEIQRHPIKHQRIWRHPRRYPIKNQQIPTSSNEIPSFSHFFSLRWGWGPVAATKGPRQAKASPLRPGALEVEDIARAPFGRRRAWACHRGGCRSSGGLCGARLSRFGIITFRKGNKQACKHAAFW